MKHANKYFLVQLIQRALGRSPEEKVKGHTGAIYRVPLMMLCTK